LITHSMHPIVDASIVSLITSTNEQQDWMASSLEKLLGVTYNQQNP
jgi:hypothetical protein